MKTIMANIQYLFRDLTDTEYQEVKSSFTPETGERYSVVATDQDKFIGCATGLAHKNYDQYQNYFFITDLLVNKEYRHWGIGKELMIKLEEKVKSLGIKFIWTWTAQFEAPEFYKKLGYEIFTTFKNWYPSGHSRIGLIKKLS